MSGGINMVVTKKLTELSKKELLRCGWIEKIAYRGEEKWTMFDFEAEDFSTIRIGNPELYEKLNVIMGKKWFALYAEHPALIQLLDIAKLDIGEGQEDAKRQIKDFTDMVINSGKIIVGVAREETSYYTFANAAAQGEIEILLDEEKAHGLRRLYLKKADPNQDLEEQKKEYKEKVEEMTRNREKNKANSIVRLERYIEELKARYGEDGLRKIIEGDIDR